MSRKPEYVENLCGVVRISDPTLDRRYITCEIEDAILIVQLKGNADSKKSVKIEV